MSAARTIPAADSLPAVEPESGIFRVAPRRDDAEDDAPMPPMLRRQAKQGPRGLRRAAKAAWSARARALEIFDDGGVPCLVNGAVEALPEEIADVVVPLVDHVVRTQAILPVLVRRDAAPGRFAMVRIPCASEPQPPPSAPRADDPIALARRAAIGACVSLLLDIADDRDNDGQPELATFARSCAAELRARRGHP